MGFFDFGDPLGTDFSGQIEIDRWVFVDKQLFGLMSIFGNGVIDGWDVTAEESLTLSISRGFGNINFTAARTEFADTIANIAPSSIHYVHARVNKRTGFDESVDFVLSTTRDIPDPNFLLLAKIVTGGVSIEIIDNSVRQEINFIELIKAAIRQHKHRGGSLNPSKIDLASEVKGQLPSFRIADFDSEKVTTGTFDLERMPLFDHQELQNVGLLTHPQLDTFVKTLQVSNKELFGEINTANFMQLVLGMKFVHDDPESAFYFADRDVDEFMHNEIAIIPGITPNSLIDFDNTTAQVNLEEHFVRGVPPVTGTSFFVTFDKALAWQSAHTLENLTIVGDAVTLAFNDADDTNILTIEGFESATADDQILDDTSGGTGLWTKQTIFLTDEAHIRADISSTNVIEGFYSGKFTHKQSFRSQFIKTFDPTQDWSTFDSLILHVKCLDQFHGPVRFFLTSGTGETSIEYVLLDTDEVTDGGDGSNNFEVRIIDLTTVPFAANVASMTIFSDDLTSTGIDAETPFKYHVDFISVQRAVLLPEEGKLKLRYSASNQVTFQHIEFNTIEPPGTDIEVRARAASGTAFLNRADFTPLLNSGDLINLIGTDIEVELVFTPDAARLSSPVLLLVRILVITEAEIDGFTINTQSEFSRGEADNVLVTTSDTLTLDVPIYVDSYYYALGNSVHQSVEDTSEDTPFVRDELGIFGNNSPISPNQVFKAAEEEQPTVTVASLFEPRSVRRQFDRSFVIADTYNDRICQFNEDGDLVSGVGSINYEVDETFPIAASVDIRTGILYVVWSKKIQFRTVNLSKFTLQTTTSKIQLIKDFDKILGLTQSELEQVQAEGQIMPVHLSGPNAGLAQNLPAASSFMFVSNDAVDSGLDTDSEIYARIITGLGIPVYIGNFVYLDGIFAPTYADKTSGDGWIIGNATVAVKGFEVEGVTANTNVSSIIEIDKNNNLIFGSNIMLFSPFVPGRVEKLDDDTLLIGGLRPDGVQGEPDSSHPFDFRSFSGSGDVRQTQKETVSQLLFSGSTPFVGAVVIFDKQAGATTFQYISPEGVVVSDVDIDTVSGETVVAESSLTQSGRIIKLDAVGNIVFSFGEGLYSLINDAVVQIDGSIVVST